jgi:hypothetical protein
VSVSSKEESGTWDGAVDSVVSRGAVVSTAETGALIADKHRMMVNKKAKTGDFFIFLPLYSQAGLVQPGFIVYNNV